ncbi:MAG: PIN domain-containing protein [Gemmataceae bacterium]
MFVLDTDTLTHLLHGHPQVVERVTRFADEVVIADASRMEVLRGRQDAVFKAADATALLRARQLLLRTEEVLARLPLLMIDKAAATEFEQLIGTKGLRRLGRGDLLNAAVALANKATLVTRNLKDFGKVPGLKVENWVD